MTIMVEAPVDDGEDLGPLGPEQSRTDAVIEDARWLAFEGLETWESAARRLGYRSVDSLKRILERAGCNDTCRRFTANASRGWEPRVLR